MITITDTELPQLVCPNDTIQSTDPGLPIANVSWIIPVVEDNSGNVTVGSDYSPGSSIPIGNTTVTITAEDASGNIMNCSFEIVIRGKHLI